MTGMQQVNIIISIGVSGCRKNATSLDDVSIVMNVISIFLAKFETTYQIILKEKNLKFRVGVNFGTGVRVETSRVGAG